MWPVAGCTAGRVGACTYHGRCGGCGEAPIFACCPVRQCCIENNYASCADCRIVSEPRQCKKFNNFMSKSVRSDIPLQPLRLHREIREKGLQGHAEIMAANRYTPFDVNR